MGFGDLGSGARLELGVAERWAGSRPVSPDRLADPHLDECPTPNPERNPWTQRPHRRPTVSGTAAPSRYPRTGPRPRNVSKASSRLLTPTEESAPPHMRRTTIRGIYDVDNPTLTLRYTLQRPDDLQNQSCPHGDQPPRADHRPLVSPDH